MMQKKYLKCAIIVLVASLTLTGCGYKDIDKRSFAVAIGIDYNEDNEELPYKLTVALAVPSTKIEPKSAITQIESIEAPNISIGLRKLKAKLDKELDLGHCKVIILGEKLANRNIAEVVYWAGRRRDIQNIAALAIGSPSAEKIVSVKPETDRFSGNTLNFFFSADTTESSYSHITTFTDLFKRLNEPGLDPVLPVIIAEDDSTFVVDSIALLDKEKVKLVLSPEETLLFNQLSKHMTHRSVQGAYEHEKTTMSINQYKATYTIKTDAVQPKIQMSIKQSVIFEELPLSYTEEEQPDYISLVKELEQAYTDEATALFEKIRAEGIDPYGFGLRYRAKHPVSLEQYYETWPSIYNVITFDINTKINLQSTGLVK